VRRAGKGNSVSLSVDGKPIEGAVVPPPAAGITEVKVEARLE
jgi:cellobiose phosphorylase